VGEGIAEEEESGLAHDRQTLHNQVEAPGDHTIHLTLSVSTAINDGSTHVHPGISIEPLLAQHGDERRKEGGGQTRVEDGLDMDDGGIRAIPFGKSGIGTSWDVPKQDAGDNFEEVVVHLLEIWFELFLDIEEESCCYGGEQTGLSPQKKMELALG